MIQEPLIPVIEKMNRSYVSSCSDEEEEEEGSTSSSSSCFKSKQNEISSGNILSGPVSRASPSCPNDKRVTDVSAPSFNNVRVVDTGSSSSRNQEDDIQVRSVSPSSPLDQSPLIVNSLPTSRNDGQGSSDPKNHPDIETVEEESTSSSTSDGKSRDALQARIVSLEEQLKSLTLLIQSLQQQQQQEPQQQRRRRPRQEQQQEKQPHEQIITNSLTSPPLLNRTKTSDLSDSQSPTTFMDKEHSNEIALSRNDHDYGGDDAEIHIETVVSHAPDLEYRSYTPNYEKELWNIRKTSRGMSLDQNDGGTSLSDTGGALSAATKRNSRNQLQDSQNDINDVSSCKNTTNVNAIDTSIKSEKNHNNPNNIPASRMMVVESAKAGETNHHKQSAGDRTPTEPANATSSGRLSTSPNFSTLSARLRSATTLKHMEEKMNTNAVVDFIRGLNIDSRRQDGSASEDVDANMEEFLRVPFRIENLLFFGLAICFDSFLNVLTVTPLKFLWSCLCLVCTIVRPGVGLGVCRFHRRHLYQLLRVFVIWFVYRYALCPISLGRLYHWIRGQAMLKLYVLMAMVVSCCCCCC